MIYSSETDELFFPSLSSVASSQDAAAFLEVLGSKSVLDHQFAANPDYDWVTGIEGIGILNGFGNYAVTGGEASRIFATSDSIVFQNSGSSTLSVDSARMDLIFDPLVDQTLVFDLESAQVFLHASTPELFEVADLSDETGIHYQIGATNVRFTGTGNAVLTDLASDAELSTIFEGVDAGALDNEEAPLSEGDADTGADEQLSGSAEKSGVAGADTFLVDELTSGDDFVFNYETFVTQTKVTAELASYLDQGLDEASNILSIPQTEYPEAEGSLVFQEQTAALAESTSDTLQQIISLNDSTELVYDDGLELYFGL